MRREVAGDHSSRWHFYVLHLAGLIVGAISAFYLFTIIHPSRWVMMWTSAVIIFGVCKLVTWKKSLTEQVPFWRHIAYLYLWPGLDPQTFLNARDANVPKPSHREWLFGAGKLVIGGVLFFGVARYIPSEHPYLIGWIGMVGIIMMLHFGSFHLVSCFWRRLGLNAQPLMQSPLLAENLSEFWGKRWNTAFRDMTYRFWFKPLTRKFGPKRGLVAGFLFSGIVHDLVISIPAGGGYGGPTIFFIIQILGMLFERSHMGRQLGLGKGIRGWAFTMSLLIIPVPLLFHPPFVEEIVVPFMRALGAL